MQTEITDVNELSSLSNQLKTLSDQLDDSVGQLNTIIKQARDYDGMDVSSAGNTLRSNLKTIASDMKNVSKNIADYTNGIATLDQDDISTDTGVFSLNRITEKVGDFLTTSYSAAILSPSKKIANALEEVTGDFIDGLTTPVTLAAGLISGIKSNNAEESVSTGTFKSAAILASEYVNTNPNTQKTGDVSGEITERTVYQSPSVVYPELGQISSYGNVVISPGDSNSDLDLSVYHNNTDQGFQVTTGNLKYEVSSTDYDMICAVVAAESDGTYDDALAVTTTILNRCETSNWVNKYSRNPIQQITAPGQFAVYDSGSYESRLNGNYTETVSKAVSDCLSGVRNHDYLFYRSNGSTSYSDNMITETGNRYGYK